MAGPLKIKVQLLCGGEVAMGPGKADLLDAIAEHGSISAAARAMGMSYRRAWQLVDMMNRCWAEPIIETSPGSARGKGAQLTGFGADVLGRYRALLAKLECAGGDGDAAALSTMLRCEPLHSQADRTAEIEAPDQTD
ncbi:MAG: ModE family transcriptional regulator [Novosphingobium sp. 12-63-9]|nr:MAG: ModE family transcriptional regulator [Novosphingobium sp. 12-63-9]